MSDATPPDDRPFTVEVSYRCPACRRRHVFTTVQAEPGLLRLPPEVACPACGTVSKPGERMGAGGTLHIVGV